MAVLTSSRRAADEEARAEVEVLTSRLEKTAQLTKKIQASLSRLEASGHTVSEAIGPIIANVSKLQILGNNIDGVIEAIDRIKQPSDTRNTEEDIIRAGPDKVGLSEFLASMGRINSALGKLKSTNLRSNQEAVADLNKILKSGNSQLEGLFQQILQEDSNPVEPLHYITKDKPFPMLTQDKTVRLGLINAHLNQKRAQTTEGAPSPTAQLYAKIRGPYIVFTLQNLAAASINTAKRKSPNTVYRRGTNGIGMYANCIEGLLAAEYDNICALFPREEWGVVFILTTKGALVGLSTTLMELNIHIKENMMTDCFLGFEIIEIIFDLSLKLDSRTGELKSAFASAVKPIRDTCKLSLAELLEDIRRQIANLQALPNDGNSIPITPQSITRLMALLDFMKPVTSIMTSIGEGNWNSISAPSLAKNDTFNIDVLPDSNKLFARYCTDTIDALLSSIEQKGRSLLKGQNLIGTFLGNNILVAERMIRTSELLPIFKLRPTCLETWRKKALSLYMEAWKDLGHTLLDSQPTTRGARPNSNSNTSNTSDFVKGLSSKEKDAIKDKFRNFNTAFEENVARHKSLFMEREVRELFGKQVQMLIEPLYNRFFDRYHEIDKGKGKYVKYNKQEMTNMLSSLAGTATLPV